MSAGGRRSRRCRSRPRKGCIRRKGAGRKPLTQTNPTLLSDLERLVDPATRGDPMSPLKLTSKSLRNLAAALCAMGHRVAP
ncbi:hypothetical protein MCHK_10615 [Mesorhizobium huakuii 7653R]|nr:hypothetical protein MCHK_10615 [Mesorhizobium huakuii 7653R]